MSTLPYTLTRDDEEIELELEYSVAAYDPGNTWGLPEDCEPPSGGEIEELEITRDGEPFELTAKEIEAVENWIYEKHDYSEEYEYD